MSISVEDLGQVVGETRWLYRALSGAFEAGHFTAVIGPNGSGKSTLLRNLVGLSTPTAGRVLLDGEPLREIDPRARARRVAYLPQSTDLYYDLTVRELVALGRAPHQGRFAPASPQDNRAIGDAMAAVGIGDLRHRGVLSLSGGERQRTMLARMLATGARTLVLDEPTSALDIGHALAFLELGRRLVEDGCTMVMALHDLELARRYADRVLCLTDGQEHHLGEVGEVLTSELLARVFHVDVHEHSDGMLFFPPHTPP